MIEKKEKRKKLCKKVWEYIDEKGSVLPVFLMDVKINNKNVFKKWLEILVKYIFDNWYKIYEFLVKRYNTEDFYLEVYYKWYKFMLRLKLKLSINNLKIQHIWLEEVKYWNSILKRMKDTWKWEFLCYEQYWPARSLFFEIKGIFIEVIKNFKNNYKNRLLKVLSMKKIKKPYKD